MAKENASGRVLTEPEKEAEVWRLLHAAMKPDDRYPYEVVRDSFGGNRRAYLEAMAPSVGIDLHSGAAVGA